METKPTEDPQGNEPLKPNVSFGSTTHMKVDVTLL